TCVCGDPPDCNDDDVCTDDFCDPADGCLNTPVDCSDLNDQCNLGVCHPASGECVTLPDNEGEPCDDDDLCTTGEACVDGACGGGTVSDCSDLDDVCLIGVCNPATGDCEAQPVENGEACNDEEVCTENDACTDGVCGGVDVDCSELDDPCNVGVCHPTTGECVTLPANEGEDCDDGNLCTANEACSAGECSGAPVECPEGESCDPKTGECLPDCGPCPTDVDGSGDTGAFDLANLLGAWGSCNPGDPCECLDADADGSIGALDLATLLGAWGPCP
ncbi:MAG: hypothetical protein IID41_09860, partial [Planctomycetes bacterium]|nr:hypothetical protein [Planctomycetota bacterium]